MLVHPTGMQSGGFHFLGNSSIGKSTLLNLACSVFGNWRKFRRTWNNTHTALEFTAKQYSDTLLTLDEIKQADPKTIGEVVYMLANEQGKGRGHRAGGVNALTDWRLLFLSSGEKNLQTILKDAGKSYDAGMDIRLVNISADVNGGSIYDAYSKADGGAMSDRLSEMCTKYHGTAGVAFIEYIQPQFNTLSDTLKRQISKLADEWIPHGADTQVGRVAQRFALVAVAGELATQAGITGWKQGEAETASLMCFENWVEVRGGVGNLENITMLSQLVGWFVANQYGRFKSWTRVGDDHDAKVSNMAGYRRIMRDGKEADLTYEKEDGQWVRDIAGCERLFYVYPEVFKHDICKGFDYRVMAQLLVDRGIIQTDKVGFMKKVRLPMSTGTTNMFVFNQSVFGALDG